MERIKIPSLFQAKSASQFLSDFIEMNRERRGFSQRSIAVKIGWPISYIPDLIRGRKKLTIARALQFAAHFRIDPIDQEKLILLAIESMGLITPTALETFKSKKNNTRYESTKDFDLLDASVFLVFEAIRWQKGSATMESLLDLTSKKGITKEKLYQCTQVLLKKDKIALVGACFEAIAEGIFSDDIGPFDDADLHCQFSKFQENFFRNRITPCCYASSFVHIENSRFMEIADRITALRNWIFEISKIDSKLPQNRDVRLFQMDFNFNAVFAKETVRKYRNGE